MKLATVKKLTLTVVLILMIALIFSHTGAGTLSSFGWESIALICPLGILETAFADGSVIPKVLPAFIACVILAALLGKVFCAWACPVPPLQRFFAPKKLHADAAALANTTPANHGTDDEHENSGSKGKKTNCSSPTSCSSCAKKRHKLDSRHLVLGGALLSSAIFGFPVFCIVCPVGLTFATIIAFWRLVGFSDPTWSLLVFPAILLIEILFLRKWCHRFCPLGALLALMSVSNRLFRPTVDTKKCLRSHGTLCTACTDSCAELLDPHDTSGMHECTKCGNCSAVCPTHAISLPLRIPRIKEIQS